MHAFVVSVCISLVTSNVVNLVLEYSSCWHFYQRQSSGVFTSLKQLYCGCNSGCYLLNIELFPVYASCSGRHYVGQRNVNTLSSFSLILLSGASTKLFLNLLNWFYLNNMTYPHQLTSHSTTPCHTAWRLYHDHRLLWRHFTRCILVCISVYLTSVCAGWQLHASDLPLPGEHKAPRAENQHNWRPVRHCAHVCDSAREAKDVSGAKLSDQATFNAPTDVQLRRQQVCWYLLTDCIYVTDEWCWHLSCSCCRLCSVMRLYRSRSLSQHPVPELFGDLSSGRTVSDQWHCKWVTYRTSFCDYRTVICLYLSLVHVKPCILVHIFDRTHDPLIWPIPYPACSYWSGTGNQPGSCLISIIKQVAAWLQ